MYFDESTAANTKLVFRLGLIEKIRWPIFRKNKTEVIWPLLLQSIEFYTDEWEAALLKFEDDSEVQSLLKQIANIPDQMKRMAEYAKTEQE